MLSDRGERNCRVSPCRLTGSQAHGPQRKSPFPCTGMEVLLFALRSCPVLVDLWVLPLTKEFIRLIRG